MFDLPVRTKREREIYRKFRKFLIKREYKKEKYEMKEKIKKIINVKYEIKKRF